MTNKELHIWFNEYYPEVTIHVYGSAIEAIKANTQIVHTTQVALARLEFIEKYGYRIFVHTYVGDTFEVKIGDCPRTNKEIRPAHNLEKLLINGEFDSVAGDVTGEA